MTEVHRRINHLKWCERLSDLSGTDLVQVSTETCRSERTTRADGKERRPRRTLEMACQRGNGRLKAPGIGMGKIFQFDGVWFTHDQPSPSDTTELPRPADLTSPSQFATWVQARVQVELQWSSIRPSYPVFRISADRSSRSR